MSWYEESHEKSADREWREESVRGRQAGKQGADEVQGICTISDTGFWALDAFVFQLRGPSTAAVVVFLIIKMD